MMDFVDAWSMTESAEMEWPHAIPAVARIAFVLTAVMGLLRLKVPIAPALLAGSVALAIFFPMSPEAFAAAIVSAVFSANTLFLVLLVTMILVLSNAMNELGHINRLIAGFRNIVGESRVMLVAFPALIGLLPMPGGAVFSAPMVGEASRRGDVSPARKTAINYWFRHVWEFWWPLFPGVIMAMALTGVEPGRFIAAQLPMTAGALVLGHLVLLRGIRLDGTRAFKLSRGLWGRLLWELVPVLIVVVSVAVLSPLTVRLAESFGWQSLLVRRSPILVGVGLSILWVLYQGRPDRRTLRRLLSHPKVWSMTAIMIAVMVFKGVLGEAGAVGALKTDLIAWHVPLVALVALLPFLAGVIVGIAVGFVGVSFPVVLALLAEAGISGPELLPYACLAYCWGFAGMMASPVHLCLLLTRDYFEASLGRVYRDLLPLVAAVLGGSLVLFFLWRG